MGSALALQLSVELSSTPLADENQANRPLVRWLATLLRPILVPDIRKKGRQARGAVLEAMQQCAEALNAGDNMLIYPAGA